MFYPGDRAGALSAAGRRPPAAGTLIFLHGRYGDADSWSSVAESLSPRFRCVAFDLPGFGKSFSVGRNGLTFQENELFIKELVSKFAPFGGGPPSTVLIGHDIGGTLVQLGARELGDRLSGLVLINSGCLSEEERYPCTGFLRAWRFHHRLKRLFESSRPIPEAVKERIVGAWTRSELRSSRVRAMQLLSETWPRIYERQAWRQFYQGLSLPVLLLWGKKDPLNPPEAGFELMRCFKRADFFELDEAGHWPQLEDPEWVLHKMRVFLFKLAPPDTKDLRQAAV